MSLGRPLLFTKQTHGDTQLLHAVLQALDVAEVSTQSELAENSFLHTNVHVVEVVVDFDDSDLILHGSIVRLEPEAILLATFDKLKQLLQVPWSGYCARDAGTN